MRFELKAIGPSGDVEALDFQAPDEASAVRSVEGRGYTVLSVRQRHGLRLPWQRGAERFPVALFSQELRVLIAAGLPLVEAIEALARYIAYAGQLEAIKKRVINASIYPALLISVGGLVSLFLLLYVVPRFGHIYQDRGTDLPLFSRLLLTWGQAVHNHAPVVLAALAALLAAAIYALRLPRVRTALGDVFWRIPAIGERLKVYQLARFYRTIGMLLRGGMPLVTALDMGAELLHPLLRERLVAASRAISEGRNVSQSMEANGLATPVALRMIAVGEKGGNMGEMLESIATFHDEELARWVDWFTRLLEPILMAIIGLVIGAIVVLMYMPIFELAGNIQ